MDPIQRHYPVHIHQGSVTTHTPAGAGGGSATAIPFASTPNGGIQFLSHVAPAPAPALPPYAFNSPAPPPSATSSSCPPAGLSNTSNNGATSGPPATAPTSTFRNLKVGGLPSDVDDADLFTIFEKFGKIDSAKVMLNVQTCESRGYGFVLFGSQEAGCRAFGEMNGQCVTVRDQTFVLDIKSSEWDFRQGAAETNAIYVRNIPNVVSDDELRAVFSTFGAITSLSTRLQHPPHSRHHANTASPAAQHQLASVTVGGATPPVAPPLIAGTPHELDGAAASPPAAAVPHLGASVDSLGASIGSVALTSLSADPLLNKLAMIEYTSVDAARTAITETHRRFFFPASGTIPLLAKFADPPQVKESRRQIKKQQQQQAAAATACSSMGLATQGASSLAASAPNVAAFVPLAHVAVGHHYTQSTSGGGLPHVLLHQPQQQQQQQQQQGGYHLRQPLGNNMGILSMQHQQHQQLSISSPSHPVMASSATSIVTGQQPPARQQHHTFYLNHQYTTATPQQQQQQPPTPAPYHPAGVRFPDAVPLPIVPRAGFQRIFYQGILGITPDGVLYPIKPEMCVYQPSSPPPQQQPHHVSATPPALFHAPPPPPPREDVAGSLGAVGEAVGGPVIGHHPLWGDVSSSLSGGLTTGLTPQLVATPNGVPNQQSVQQQPHGGPLLQLYTIAQSHEPSATQQQGYYVVPSAAAPLQQQPQYIQFVPQAAAPAKHASGRSSTSASNSSGGVQDVET